MAQKGLHTTRAAINHVYWFTVVFLISLLVSRTGSALVVIQPVVPVQPIRMGSINPLGTGSMGMPTVGVNTAGMSSVGQGYGGSIMPIGGSNLPVVSGAGIGSVGQGYGGSVMPIGGSNLQVASGVIVTDAAGMQKVATGTNAGPIVAIDKKLLDGIPSTINTPKPPPPPPPETSEDPPEEPDEPSPEESEGPPPEEGPEEPQEEPPEEPTEEEPPAERSDKALRLNYE
ncbi:uncharacterized protein LOC144118785 isoform X1 [Amblyomma americanum]